MRNFVKYLKTLFIVFCLMLTTKAYCAYQLYADIDGIKLPYGTKFELKMAQNLTTLSALEGDLFEAYLTRDVYVNNKLVLPSRTMFRGRVSQIVLSRALSRPASLYLTLDHLVTKKGVQLPINSGLSSNFEYVLKSDGSLTTNGNYFSAVGRDLKKAGQIVPRAVEWGQTAGDDIFTGAKFLFVPIAAIGGCAACVGSSAFNIIANLFRHGDEIIIKKDAPFEIILLGTVEVPN